MCSNLSSPNFARHLMFGLWTTLCVAHGTAPAQSIWEASPYRIEVWVAVEPHARVDAEWQTTLPARIEQLAQSRIGSAWRLTAQPVPAEFAGDLLSHRQPDLVRLEQKHPVLAERDKLMFLVVQNAPTGYRISVREVDRLTRHWSLPARRTVPLANQIAVNSLELLCEVFVPLAQIDRVSSTVIEASVRGGALVQPIDSVRRGSLPTRVDVHDVLQPVIVRKRRSGEVRPDGVRIIDWTVLIVTDRDGSRVRCGFESGYRQPFSTRRSSRVQQVAFVLKPRLPSTTLKLVDRRDADEPLVGYEVFSLVRNDDEAPHRLGRTNWRGELAIERSAEHPVQILFVRSGQQLLGKLPIVVGNQPRVTAPLRNDDARLEAEGFLLGVQDSLVDLVARREVLAARIRRAIEEDDLESADQLLRELKQLDTQDDFSRRVQQRRRTLSSGDTDVQHNIDQLFAQTRSLLGKYLSHEQVDALSRELESARRSNN